MEKVEKRRKLKDRRRTNLIRKSQEEFIHKVINSQLAIINDQLAKKKRYY
jgi:hypothetical protein